MASLIDINALAEEWDTTVSHLRGLVYRKAIPYKKVGHLVRFDPAELDSWLDDNRVDPAS